MNLYIGNLSWTCTEDELQRFFESCGTVDSCKIVKDKVTNRSRGFAFVEMPNDDEAREAVDKLNGANLGGRAISVNEARPREDRPSGGGGGGFRPRRGGFDRGNDRD